MAIRWIMDTKATGLAAIGARPRGATLKDTKTDEWYMNVVADRSKGHQWTAGGYDQWRFIVLKPGANLRSKNAWATFEEAKAHAQRYWDANKEAMIKEKAEYRAKQIKEKAAQEAMKQADLDQARKLGGLPPKKDVFTQGG